VLRIVKRRNGDWIGHILHSNCPLKEVIEGKIEGMKRRGRRRKLLVHQLNDKILQN